MKSATFKVLVPAVAAAIALAGCTGAPAPSGSATAAGPVSDTLRINWGSFPLSWEPGSNAMQPGHFRLPYETLLNRTHSGEILPGLATDWEMGEGAMSITLTLREGVLFHDGEPFNAEAVKTNIEYVTEVVGGQFGGPFAAVLESVEVVDDYTITINFTRPFGTATALLSDQTLPIGSPAAIADGSIATHPVGTSPWAYDPERSVEGTSMFFAQFADYWGELPPFANIEMVAIADDTAATAAVLSGEIDVTDVEAESLPLVEASPDVAFYEYAALRNAVIFFARGAGQPLEDVRVRQALCYSLDMEAYGELDPLIYPGTQHFLEGEPGYNPEITGYPHDLERAEELLAEAGNPTVELVFPAAPFNKQQVEVYADSFNQLPGVNVTVQELAVPEFVSTWSSGQFPLGIGSLRQVTPADWYNAWFSPRTPSNPSGAASPELLALVEAAQQAAPGPEQNEAWAAVMKQISDEALACGHTVAGQAIAYNTTRVTDVMPTEIAAAEPNLIDYHKVRPVNG